MGVFDPNNGSITDTEWLVENHIPMGGYCLVAAQPGVGKSYILEALAVDVVCGGSFLGENTVKGDVLLIDEDSNAQHVHHRLKKFFSIYPNYDRSSKLYCYVREGYRITDGNTSSLRSLINREEHKNVKLIILDSLRSLTAGKSSLDNTRDSSSVVDLLQGIERDGVTVLVVHHISTKANLTAIKAMTCDNPDGLIMNNTALVSASQAAYILASPTRGGNLEELYIRPVTRRVLLPKPFCAKLWETEDSMFFTKTEYHLSVDNNHQLPRWELRIISHFTPGATTTVKQLHIDLAECIHINTLRDRLESLEDKGLVEVVSRSGRGGAHEYQLTERGIEVYYSLGITPAEVHRPSVSLMPSTFRKYREKSKSTK